MVLTTKREHGTPRGEGEGTPGAQVVGGPDRTGQGPRLHQKDRKGTSTRPDTWSSYGRGFHSEDDDDTGGSSLSVVPSRLRTGSEAGTQDSGKVTSVQ